MADIKNLLKETRKLIDEKKYDEAQECCKNILRKDKQNYLGLVLLGKSLQDSDQAALAFQKAISTKGDHPLAWQGLANYYERKEDISTKNKLFSIYAEILKLQVEEDKITEIITKLSQLGCSLKNSQSISILIDYMDKKLDDKIFLHAERQLLELLKSGLLCRVEDIPRIKQYLKEIIKKQDSNTSIKILLGNIVMQNNNLDIAFEEVLRLDFFNSSVEFREWLCKCLCTKFVQQDSFGEVNIEAYINRVTAGIENSKYPGLLNSMIHYSKGLYLEAYKQCVPLVNYQEADLIEATFIIKCTFMLKKWLVAQKLATNFLMKVKDTEFTYILKKFLFISLAEQQKWKQAISVAKEVPNRILNESEHALLAKCYIESNESAGDIMENLQTTEHYTQLEALSLIKQEKFTDAITLLEKSEENSINLYYIGISYWALQEYDKCYVNLLKAAKLNADHGDTFLYLGKFFQYFKLDFQKARRCYEKAYNLNNNNIETIQNLSDVYLRLNLKKENFDLLHKASHNVETTLPWINFRLGLHYINNRDWENSIMQFRNVIKVDNKDVTAFECLADAYYSRGSFTSALKAYDKVMTMRSDKTLYCLTKIGHIYSLLTQYDEAISTFKKVLTVDPHSLLALKGISDTWIKVAKKQYTAKLYGSARDTAQNAVNYLVRALTKEHKFICFWNLLADILMFITKLPDQYSFVFINNTLNENEEIVRKDKLDIYPQALACYSHIAKQKQQFTSYDLATTYLKYYYTSKNVNNCYISFQLAVACVKLKPLAWRNWNLLGRICMFMKKYSLAQHCFIKALLVTRKWSNAPIWCNLGTLYVKLKLYKLANYCFWRGQSTLPSYPQSWIGQGLIAEVIREEEAMDLFRHASRLGYDPESALGYADWVCRTLKKYDYDNSTELKYVIDSLHAIPYAMDLLMWFSKFEPCNPCACNILGLLRERSGLLNTALQSYEKAFKYADEKKRNIVLLNIGRIFLRLKKYDEAVKIYKSITEASFDSACGLALALFKKGLYEESYAAYDTAYHWLCNDDEDKADLLIAMAGIVYMFKGLDDAKTLLFHSIQVSQKKPSPYSLFAICSLGIIHSDQSLSKLAMGELQKYEKDSQFGYDIGFLKFYHAGDDLKKAIKILSSSILDHPSNSQLWFIMAQYCLKESNLKPKISSCCAQKALNSTHDAINNSAKILATASVAEYLAGDKIKALLLTKIGLHLYPCQSEIWAALLLSVMTNKTWTDRKQWILGAVAHVRKNINTSRALSRWLNHLEKKILSN